MTSDSRTPQHREEAVQEGKNGGVRETGSAGLRFKSSQGGGRRGRNGKPAWESLADAEEELEIA